MEWISVEDFLPEIGKEVLIASTEKNNEAIYVGWIEKFGIKDKPIWRYSACCGCYAEDITHWAELPELPMEIENEK